MMIAVGSDIVRIARLSQHASPAFLARTFTARELHICEGRAESLAGRWAAKEAVMKTFGTGFTKGVGWKDIEVVSLKSGQPVIELSGGAARYAEKAGIDEVLITISHCRAYATATAVALQHRIRREGEPST